MTLGDVDQVNDFLLVLTVSTYAVGTGVLRLLISKIIELRYTLAEFLNTQEIL